MPSPPSSPTTTGEDGPCAAGRCFPLTAPCCASRRPCAPFLCPHLCLCFAFRENRPRNGGICVANHTSPIDVIILASDGYYAMVRCAAQLCLPGWAAQLAGPAASCAGQGGGSKRLSSVQNCLSLRDTAGRSAPVHRCPVVRGLGSAQSASPAGPPAQWKGLEATSVLPARAWDFSSQPCQGRGGEMNLSGAVKLRLVTCVLLPRSGGSDPRGAHGCDSESHGEGLPPRLV